MLKGGKESYGVAAMTEESRRASESWLGLFLYYILKKIFGTLQMQISISLY